MSVSEHYDQAQRMVSQLDGLRHDAQVENDTVAEAICIAGIGLIHAVLAGCAEISLSLPLRPLEDIE